MRLYVLCFSDYEGIAPHIIAEVVRENVGEEPATSLASALAGDRSLIVTRAELLSEPMGRAALEAWDDRNDSEYRLESEAILAEDANAAARRLHLVADDEPPRIRRRIPTDVEQRNVFFRAMALRATTRELLERAREQRTRAVAAHDQGVGIHEIELAADND